MTGHSNTEMIGKCYYKNVIIVFLFNVSITHHAYRFVLFPSTVPWLSCLRNPKYFHTAAFLFEDINAHARASAILSTE